MICQNGQANYPVNPNLKIHEFRRFRPAGISYRLEKLFFEQFAAQRYDLAHPTYYKLLSRSDFRKYRCPVVVTVWDMIHELFPAQLDPRGQVAEEKGRAIMAAQVVICISENTKKDLLEHYSLPESRVRVTHLAADIDASCAYGSQPVPSRPYFLYVGRRYTYKNFDGVLKALAKVRSKQPDTVLCVVGAAFDEVEMKLIHDLKVADGIAHYGHVNDAHLAKLYRLSVAFVYPSFYEGFGIPPLEAMACGTPVVASNRSSLPEVVGDAGLLFDPDSLDDLADIMLHLLADQAERERLIAKGYQRAKAFSWDQTAAQTVEIYRSLS